MVNKKEIDINGNLLHEVGMRLVPHSPKVISTLMFPMTRINHNFSGETLLIEVPSFLAVELYRNETIPQKQDTPVVVKLDGIHIGSFLIQDVIYPNDTAKNSIRFKFVKLDDLEQAIAPTVNS